MKNKLFGRVILIAGVLLVVVLCALGVLASSVSNLGRGIVADKRIMYGSGAEIRAGEGYQPTVLAYFLNVETYDRNGAAKGVKRVKVNREEYEYAEKGMSFRSVVPAKTWYEKILTSDDK